MDSNETKTKLKEKIDKEALANKIAGDFDVQSAEGKEVMGTKYGADITENQMFEALEVCSYALLQNLRRPQCVDIMKEYFEEHGIVEGKKEGQISRARLLKIYRNARNQLFTRKIKDLEIERNQYVTDMHRLARKAEHSMAWGDAVKCLKEIAEVTGVFKTQDDSKITLNFLTALKKEE
jgi:hypothetical protein